MYVCCKCCVLSVLISVSGWSPVQRSPAVCGVSGCDREASIMRRSRPTRGSCVMGVAGIGYSGYNYDMVSGPPAVKITYFLFGDIFKRSNDEYLDAKRITGKYIEGHRSEMTLPNLEFPKNYVQELTQSQTSQ